MIVRRLALLVGSFGVTLLGAEVGCRLAGFDFDRQESAQAAAPIFYRQPRVPVGEVFFRRAGPATWTGSVLPESEPITVVYDPEGFRNPAEMTDWEIVVAGDSFVESGYLPERKLFTSILGRELGVRVKNLGVSHTGPLTSRFYLETYGVASSTRHAVLAFFEGSDLDDLEAEAAALARFEGTGERDYRRIVPQSSLLEALRRRLVEVSGPSDEPAPNPLLKTNANLLLPGRRRSRRVDIFYAPQWRVHVGQWRETLLDDALGQWAATARSLGLEPWLLYLPCKHRILHPWIEYDPGTDTRLTHWSPSDLPELVAELAATHRIGLIDPIGDLSAATARGVMTFNLSDSHLSAPGQRVVAGALAEALGDSL